MELSRKKELTLRIVEIFLLAVIQSCVGISCALETWGQKNVAVYNACFIAAYIVLLCLFLYLIPLGIVVYRLCKVLIAEKKEKDQKNEVVSAENQEEKSETKDVIVIPQEESDEADDDSTLKEKEDGLQKKKKNKMKFKKKKQKLQMKKQKQK